MQKVTDGYIKRKESLEQKKMEKEAKEREKQEKLQASRKKDLVSKIYKKNMLDTFKKIFNTNYGEQFDYSTIEKSLKITVTQDKKGNFVPQCEIDESQLKFISEQNTGNKPFNQNSTKEFTTNEELISGEEIDYFSFDNREEYEEYLESENELKLINSSQNEYTPTLSNKDRYGSFNKINKELGYETVENSSKEALKKAKNKWELLKRNF